MFRRVWWLLFPALIFAGLYATGCGSDTSATPDDAGLDGPDLDGTVEGATDDGGGGDGARGDAPPACNGAGFPCAANGDCCSNLCDGNSKTCVSGISKCGGAGAKCAAHRLLHVELHQRRVQLDAVHVGQSALHRRRPVLRRLVHRGRWRGEGLQAPEPDVPHERQHVHDEHRVLLR